MTVVDRVPLERIRTEARTITPGRTLLLILTGVLFAFGWVAAKTFGVLWGSLAWCAAAVKVGWQAARVPDGTG
jgi:hypothetical protein